MLRDTSSKLYIFEIMDNPTKKNIETVSKEPSSGGISEYSVCFCLMLDQEPGRPICLRFVLGNSIEPL